MHILQGTSILDVLFAFTLGSDAKMANSELIMDSLTTIMGPNDMVVGYCDSDVITLGDYHQLMYGDLDSGYVAVGHKDANGWSQRMYGLNDWFNHIDLTKNCYVSVNTFGYRKRQDVACRHLNVLYIDIDCYSAGKSQDDVLEAIDFEVRNERIPEPTIVTSSGRGIYVMYKINSVPGISAKARKYYGYVLDYLITLFNDVGADPAASDVARVLRVPGTVNYKDGSNVKILRWCPDNRYSLRDFDFYINADGTYDDLRKRNKKISKKKNVHNLYNKYTLARARIDDINQLCAMRNYDVYKKRDIIIYIYHHQWIMATDDEERALTEALNLNQKFLEPLTENEVESYIKSSVNAYKNSKTNPLKSYRFTNKTLISLFEVERYEMYNLKTIIDKEERNRRKKIVNAVNRRDENGKTSREAQKEKNIKMVQMLLEQGFKQKDIVIKTGLSKGYVSKIVKSIKVP